MATLKDLLNQATPQALADYFRVLQLGNVLRSLPVHLTKAAPVAGTVATGNLTTVDVLKLPNDAKAAAILRCTVRAGGSVGEFTLAAPDATPTTTQVGITPCGDIAFLHATDLVTDVDVTYVPQMGEVVEFFATAATGVVTIPAAYVARGVICLLEAEVISGTTLGGKRILTPLAGGGAGLPATTLAQLTSNKSTVSFNSATDAPVLCRVKCLIGTNALADMNVLLGAAAPF